jgi:hypothetical protein
MPSVASGIGSRLQRPLPPVRLRIPLRHAQRSLAGRRAGRLVRLPPEPAVLGTARTAHVDNARAAGTGATGGCDCRGVRRAERPASGPCSGHRDAGLFGASHGTGVVGLGRSINCQLMLPPSSNGLFGRQKSRSSTMGGIDRVAKEKRYLVTTYGMAIIHLLRRRQIQQAATRSCGEEFTVVWRLGDKFVCALTWGLETEKSNGNRNGFSDSC